MGVVLNNFGIRTIIIEWHETNFTTAGKMFVHPQFAIRLVLRALQIVLCELLQK